MEWRLLAETAVDSGTAAELELKQETLEIKMYLNKTKD